MAQSEIRFKQLKNKKQCTYGFHERGQLYFLTQHHVRLRYENILNNMMFHVSGMIGFHVFMLLYLVIYLIQMCTCTNGSGLGMNGLLD